MAKSPAGAVETVVAEAVPFGTRVVLQKRAAVLAV